MCNSQSFSMNADGIWGFSDYACAIGVVVFAHYENHVVVIRKAHVKGYEFGGKFAFPGGIVRDCDGGTMRDALNQSVHRRARSESGLELDKFSVLDGVWGETYPVTQYSVKGKQKFTAVVPVIAALTSRPTLDPQDPSVDEALWINIDALGTIGLAPANAVIASQVCEMTFGKTLNNPLFDNAQATCLENARLVFQRP